MKRFKDFVVSEEVDLTANVEGGTIDIHNDAVRNNINAFLNGELACAVITPYVALNKVNKVLANFHIYLPKAPFMENSHGVHVFNINQFNRLAGMRNDGEVVTKISNPYNLFFEWKRNERGLYDVFAEIVSEEELSNLLDAVSDDVDNSEDDREEKLDESVLKYIMSKVGLLGLKKKTKKPLDTRPEYSLGNDQYDDDPRNQIREAKKAPKLKTNAPVLRAALAKAKTELATLKAAYRTPNQTKQPSKSMSLSHPAPEPTETETQPLSKEKEEYIHQFGYLKEAASSKKKKIKELASKQRLRYAMKRGEPAPVLEKGKTRYNITQKEKSSLKNILAKQKQHRKAAKEITKAARANPPSMSAYHVPNETKQPAKSMPASHPAPTPKPQSFESHIEAYHSTGNKDHLKAARQHAEMEYDRERERIRRSGVTGAQHHVDNKWNTGMYKDRMKRLDALEGVPKKGLMTRIKSMFKEEDELDEQYGTNIE